jgi:hypothetical protein
MLNEQLTPHDVFVSHRYMRELIDIAVPHQINTLLPFEYDLYSIGTDMMYIESPTKLHNIHIPNFTIAKPIALLYELSVIQLPMFETRETKLKTRKQYINYLEGRNNVKANKTNKYNSTRKKLIDKNEIYNTLLRTARPANEV